jgi:lysophospholipase L1-like esterase
MSITFTKQSKLLFIGDSITDCGRRECTEQIGDGYVRLLRDLLCVREPETAPNVINRGISGNKIPDLQKRWRRDVLDERPDVLSIFIGINDVWHGLVDGRSGCAINDYVAGYRDVLNQTRDVLPRCILILCEPSVLWLDTPPDANDHLDPYIAAVRQLATEFDAHCVVPLHDAFARARDARPELAWTTDGVHPTSAGHMLIAQTWLHSVRENRAMLRKSVT